MLAKGKVLGWWGGSRADGVWKCFPQAPGCCLSTISKCAKEENSSGEILVLGRRLSYCLWKTPSCFRSQHSRSDETGLQKVILVNPLPSWNYSVSELHESLHTTQFIPYPGARVFSAMLMEGHLYLLEASSGRESAESQGGPSNRRLEAPRRYSAHVEWTSALLSDLSLGSKLALKGSAEPGCPLADVTDYHVLQRTVDGFQPSSAACASSMIHSVSL